MKRETQRAAAHILRNNFNGLPSARITMPRRARRVRRQETLEKTDR
jgi:hypothetical protein